MKKLLSLVIVMGFVIMLGTAGSADVAGMSVLKAVLFEVLGMIIVLFGTSALMHYNRYSRKRCYIYFCIYVWYNKRGFKRLNNCYTDGVL